MQRQSKLYKGKIWQVKSAMLASGNIEKSARSPDTFLQIYYGNVRSVFNWNVIVFKMEAYFTDGKNDVSYNAKRSQGNY